MKQSKTKLPKHLQKVIDDGMKTDKGRKQLAKMIGAKYYRKKSGKIVSIKD